MKTGSFKTQRLGRFCKLLMIMTIMGTLIGCADPIFWLLVTRKSPEDKPSSTTRSTVFDPFTPLFTAMTTAMLLPILLPFELIRQLNPDVRCDNRKRNFEQMSGLKEEPLTEMEFSVKRQRVVRKDCSGNITSDKEEVVSTTGVQRSLRPEVVPTTIQRYELFLSTTCAYTSGDIPKQMDNSLVGELTQISASAPDGRLVVRFSLESALNRFALKEGNNRVFYRYTTNPPCTTTADNKTNCPAPQTIIAGVFPIYARIANTEVLPTTTVQETNCSKK